MPNPAGMIGPIRSEALHSGLEKIDRLISATQLRFFPQRLQTTATGATAAVGTTSSPPACSRTSGSCSITCATTTGPSSRTARSDGSFRAH